VSKPWWLAVLRLFALLAGVGLVTSRVGLIVHELVGHGGTAVLCGGDVTDFQLFWFAGGWIRYDLAEPSRAVVLAISLGGIAVEAALGSCLWWGSRARAATAVLARRLVRGVGGALIIHAAWYLATGTWHGYGDGVPAYHALGDLRYPVAIAVGLLACWVAYATARWVLGALAATLPGSRRARIAGLSLAAVAAGVVQLGLSVGETRIRGDATYGAIMRPERERVVARELAAWQRAQAARGLAISDAEREAEARRLAAQHREPPFLPVLLVLLVGSAIAGAVRAREAPPGAVSRRILASVMTLAVGSVALVIAIDLLFH